MLERQPNHHRHQTQQHRQRAAFTVFADPPQPDNPAQTPSRPVLRQADATKKTLRLSPRSRVTAEKENFDLVRKQLTRPPCNSGISTKPTQRTPLAAKSVQNKPAVAAKAKEQSDDPFKTPTRKQKQTQCLAPPPNIKLGQRRKKTDATGLADNVTGTVRFRRTNKPRNDIDDLVQLLGNVDLDTRELNSVADLSPVSKRTVDSPLLQLTLPPPLLPRTLHSEPPARVLFAESLTRARSRAAAQTNTADNSESRRAKKAHPVGIVTTPPDMRQSIR